MTNLQSDTVRSEQLRAVDVGKVILTLMLKRLQPVVPTLLENRAGFKTKAVGGFYRQLREMMAC